MFKKLVSNLPFSPSLVGQLSFYVKRLRQEEITRRAGLILTALAVIVQGVIIFAPAETQAAASNNDIIYGGWASKTDLLRIYDKNSDSVGHKDIQQIYSYFGVSRTDIANGYIGHINSKDYNGGIWSIGRYAYQKPGEQAQQITGTGTTIYMRKLTTFEYGSQTRTGNTYSALIGKRSVDGQWFAILLECGNLEFLTIPTPKPTPTPTPTPTPPKTTTPGTPSFTPTKTVTNLTTGTSNANNTTANAGDELKYTLTVKNTGTASGIYTIKDTISDVLEYADIVDQGGGTLQANSSGTTNTTPDTIVWPTVTVAAGATATDSFTVRIKSEIPTTATNPTNGDSYNCQITNTFGEATNVTINCPPAKTVETVTTDLPSTGPTENMIFGGGALAIVAYFYVRSRQLGREVRLIRRDANAGTI